MTRSTRSSIKGLYYITHIDNLPSILSNGILSHELIEERRIQFSPIYDAGIVSRRKGIQTPEGRSLWSYANLYFQPRNPMLYRVLHEKNKADLAILGIQAAALTGGDVLVTTGNAAHSESEILPAGHGLKAVAQDWQTIKSEWWNPLDGSKRRIMAECLVPNMIPPALYPQHLRRQPRRRRARQANGLAPIAADHP